MEILSGLFAHMVVQRNRNGVSDAGFTGRATAMGKVMATVRSATGPVKGCAGAAVGTAAGGEFSGRLSGLPTGGPYTIELSIESKAGKVAETTTVEDVLVGDVWLLGGQSNMQGVGLLKEAEPPHPCVRAFYMHDVWAPAVEPIHNLWGAVDEVHGGVPGAPMPAGQVSGVGPGVAFGNEVLRLTGGVPQGLICCGHGGTSMEQWDPDKLALGSKSLYGAMIRRFHKNGGAVAGLVWYQGESDAHAAASPLYTANMEKLVAALRRDTATPGLPVAIVQISRVTFWGAGTSMHWNSIQDQQRRLPDVIDSLAVVPAIDLSLDDGIHISGHDCNRLGRRLARAMENLRGNPKCSRPPLALGSVTVRTTERPPMGEVVVEFRNVAGALQSGSRPAGFTVTDANGMSHHIYDTQTDGPRAILRTGLPPSQLEECSVMYGKGTDPYCNVTDLEDRAVPVLGPIALGKPHAWTAYIQTWRVSAVLPSRVAIQKVNLPRSLAALSLNARTFDQAFADRHVEIQAVGAKPGLVWYACAFECPEAMKVTAWLGYDGPVKAWLDGQQVFVDPAGTNPAVPNAGRATPVSLKKGAHELVIALNTNLGRAWGVFCRIERNDADAERLAKAPETVRLPTIIG